ncbi:hypothetical protein MY10362_008829 [Beauveria mimosiformis]
MSGRQSDGAQRARDSFASILSYYLNHVPESEAPEFVKRASSGEILFAVRIDEIPSPDRPKEMQKQLQDALETKEAIEKLSTAEKHLMMEAAAASLTARKGKAKKDKEAKK